MNASANELLIKADIHDQQAASIRRIAFVSKIELTGYQLDLIRWHTKKAQSFRDAARMAERVQEGADPHAAAAIRNAQCRDRRRPVMVHEPPVGL